MVCEDGSPDEIGEIVVTMYRQCAEGDFSLVNKVKIKTMWLQLTHRLTVLSFTYTFFCTYICVVWLINKLTCSIYYCTQTIEREKARQDVVARSTGLEASGDVLEEDDGVGGTGGGPSSSEMMQNNNSIVEEEAQLQAQVPFVPEVDEEGFETVVRGKRTRSNKRYG